MSDVARIFHLAVSDGGVPKHPINEGVVTLNGILGDRQKHLKIHGGPNRALCLYSLELIEKLQAEGHPIFPGATGENVTIHGLPWSVMRVGLQLALGEHVIVELTWEAAPCKNIRDSFAHHKFRRLEVAGEMRWYCKIIREGTLVLGHEVRVVPSGSDVVVER